MALFVAFAIGIPIAELYAFVQVAGVFGFWPALFAVIALSVIGTWVVKLAGWSVVRKLQATVRGGTSPTRELIDGFVVAVAGLLLVVPGFVTGVVGLVVLFPPTRALVRRLLVGRFHAGGFHVGGLQTQSNAITMTHSGPASESSSDDAQSSRNTRSPTIGQGSLRPGETGHGDWINRGG